MAVLSAAIITYNRARFLGDAIESVLGQTVGDLELIVVDDGSEDGTAAAVAPYLDRIRYVRRPHQGRAVARNTAVELAEGELIAFCDSDDRWYPDRLERQLDALDRNPDAGMVHGQVELTDADGRALHDETAAHRKVFSDAHEGGATYAGYAGNCRCLSSTILVRRHVFEKIGFYDRTLPIEDYDFYLRLVRNFNVVFLEGAPLAQHRRHAQTTPSEELAFGQIRTAEKHLAFLDEHPELPDARAARRNFNLMIARSWRVLGDRRRARAAACRALLLGAPEALRIAL